MRIVIYINKNLLYVTAYVSFKKVVVMPIKRRKKLII